MVEINLLKVKVETLESDLNDTRNEVIDLKEKVDRLEQIVEEMSERLLTITTPTKKGTKKRRKVKQHLTPSPSRKKEDIDDNELVQSVEGDYGQGASTEAELVTQQSDDSEEITAEEIMKMYESG